MRSSRTRSEYTSDRMLVLRFRLGVCWVFWFAGFRVLGFFSLGVGFRGLGFRGLGFRGLGV